MPSNTVASVCACSRPAVEHDLVDDQLVHRQVRARHAGDALGERDRVAASSSAAGTATLARPHSAACAPVIEVAGEHQLLGARRAEAEGPHRRRRAAPDARRHVADLGVVGHHQQVAAQRDVAAAGDRVAVHLGDGRLRSSARAP